MKLAWSILCTNSTINKDTNNISITDVIEKITYTPNHKLKAENKLSHFAIKEMDMVSLWFHDKDMKEDNLELLVELINPDKKPQAILKSSILIPKDKKRMRVIFKITNLHFEKSGDYLFSIKKKEDKKYKIVSEIPLEIKINN